MGYTPQLLSQPASQTVFGAPAGRTRAMVKVSSAATELTDDVTTSI